MPLLGMHAAGPNGGPGAAAPGAFWGLFRGEKSPAGGRGKAADVHPLPRPLGGLPSAPLLKGGAFGRCVRREWSGGAARRAADSRPYRPPPSGRCVGRRHAGDAGQGRLIAAPTGKTRLGACAAGAPAAEISKNALPGSAFSVSRRFPQRPFARLSGPQISRWSGFPWQCGPGGQ